jgi:hypothetical protein
MIIYQVDTLNNYIPITQLYGKYKRSYMSVICMAHKILFIIGRRRTIDLPPVEGVDDGTTGYGVSGRSNSGDGVRGSSNTGVGVYSSSNTGVGVYAKSLSGRGVIGLSESGDGVHGASKSNKGVFGFSESNDGVYGASNSGHGVVGSSESYDGVVGSKDERYGVSAFSKSIDYYALYAGSSFGYAAHLDGEVYVRGPLIKSGGGFEIDHPLDPANKHLSHSFVESPDMKNVYDGIVVLDRKSKAEIELPNWFGALNKDFRYQLTAIGAPGPNLYIAEEISEASTTTNYSSNSGNNNNNNSRFKIAGGTSGMKVSWQVTGIRKDPWANANRIQIEEDKPAKERGYYLYPDLYDQPEEKGISHLLFPKEKQELLVNENQRSNL